MRLKLILPRIEPTVWLTLGLTVDDTTGLVLTLDDLSGEDAETLTEWLEPITEAVEADLMVTDDADALKIVADELGLDQQVCKGHVTRNIEALIDNLQSTYQIPNGHHSF